MIDYEKLAASIKRIAGTQNNNLILFEAQIKSVDTQTQTCTITRYDVDIDNVRLCASLLGDNDFVAVPTVGSMVIVADLSAPLMRDMAVLCYSKIDNIVFQGGENGGLIKISELITKLNTIEDEINNLKQILKAPQVNTYGGIIAPNFTTWANQPITKTKQSDLENTNFKH